MTVKSEEYDKSKTAKTQGEERRERDLWHNSRRATDRQRQEHRESDDVRMNGEKNGNMGIESMSVYDARLEWHGPQKALFLGSEDPAPP